MRTGKSLRKYVAIVLLGVLALSSVPVAYGDGIDATIPVMEGEPVTATSTEQTDPVVEEETIPTVTLPSNLTWENRVLRTVVVPVVENTQETKTTPAETTPTETKTTETKTQENTQDVVQQILLSSQTVERKLTTAEEGGGGSSSEEITEETTTYPITVTSVASDPQAAVTGTTRRIIVKYTGVQEDIAPTGKISVKVGQNTYDIPGSSLNTDGESAVTEILVGADGTVVELGATYVSGGEDDVYTVGGSKTGSATIGEEKSEPEPEEQKQKGLLLDTEAVEIGVLSFTNNYAISLNPVGPFAYTGSAIKPTVTLIDNDNSGNPVPNFENDYTVVFDPAEPVNAGTVTVTVTNDVTSTENDSTTYQIGKKNISTDVTATLSAPAGVTDLSSGGTYKYLFSSTVNPIKPNVSSLVLTTAGYANYNLQSGDYVVTHDESGLTNGVGTADVVITGSGANFEGELRIPYTVEAQSTQFTVAAIGDQTYTGSAITPKPVVTAGTKTLEEGAAKHYTVTYRNNTSVGTAYAIITGTGITYDGGTYTGTVEVPFQIVGYDSTTTLTASYSGGVLTFTAKVVGKTVTTPVPEGTVRFVISSGLVNVDETVTLSGGTASVSLPSSAPTGTYTGTATYTPSATSAYQGSDGSIKVTPPTVTLSITGTGVRGETATILVTVSGKSGTPTGTVDLTLNGYTLTRLRLDSNGQATYTLWNYPWSYEELVAHYLGDSTYMEAYSKPVSRWDDNLYLPTITLDADVGSGSKATTLTAYVTGYRWYAVPTGFVSFYNGNTLLGTVKLDSSGVASLTWKSVPSGTHEITALYQGDDLYRTVYTVKTITKKSSSSGSSSGSGSSNIGTSETPLAGSADVILRDIDGNVLSGFDTTTITVQPDGTMVLETTAQQDYYSYGFPVQRLSEISASNANGYFNIVTPSVNIHMPYNVISGLEGLSDYVRQNNLNQSQLELRLVVRSVNDNTIQTAYKNAYPQSNPIAYLRMELSIYSSTGKRLDFTPTQITTPLQLIIPTSQTTGTADWYDEQTRTFSSALVEFGSNAMAIDIEHNGIYVVAQ